MKFARCLVAALLASAAAVAGAQGWSPQKNVELVVPNPPGGSNDKTARTVERIWSMNKILPATLSVVNRAGGGGSIAYTYVSQHAGARITWWSRDRRAHQHITAASKLHHTTSRRSRPFNDYTCSRSRRTPPSRPARTSWRGSGRTRSR